MTKPKSGRDKVVEVRTYIHTDDIDRIDNTEGTGNTVYVSGEDRMGWHFCGYMSAQDLATVLFPEAS